ncbi:MAG TPA: dethiobiotin synthase [Thiotrichaceae bacterium]|jgi:dethiobiotin synthetase|nr:dethiobiotin synthase [Thiotrichaceae bacterium]HIM08459.1 dethiobiotin synthase [Gammaproteobacteria bacterium]
MSKGIFITGTDTGIGKTRFTLALMTALKNQGHQVSGMKPIASGARLKNGRIINEDAELIMRYCSKSTDYHLINPAVFELAVAPHIASSKKNEKIDLNQIIACYRELASNSRNVIVEGVGGWRVPLSNKESLVDLVRSLELPVIMVVGLKLGCINHALLTAEAIKADGLILKGWVSNRLDKDYLFHEETIETIKAALECPHIADLPYMVNFEPDKLFENIDLSDIS